MNNKPNEKSDKAREHILGRLKSASKNISGSTPDKSWSVRVFPQPVNLLKTFIDEFNKVSGQMAVCHSKEEITNYLDDLNKKGRLSSVFCVDDELKTLLPGNIALLDEDRFVDVEVGITRCEYLIARSGSIMVSSAQQSGRRANVFPPVHIVVAHENQLVPFIEDAIRQLKEKYNEQLPSQVTVITGPSRTADIEKTLVMGAHGPKELILLIHK